MGQTINVQKPDRPVHGATIQRSTIAGRKAEFVQQSGSASTNFTVPAGSSHSLSVTYAIWDSNLPLTAQNINNLIAPKSTIAWIEYDIYIDTQDGSHYFGSGASLTAAQHKVHYSHVKMLTPYVYSGSTPYSASESFDFRNDDAADHIVYITLQYKYLTFGDASL